MKHRLVGGYILYKKKRRLLFFSKINELGEIKLNQKNDPVEYEKFTK